MKLLAIANWKMNPVALKQTHTLFDSIKQGVEESKNAEVVICPPFVWLPELRKAAVNSNILLGAQDCFWKEKGPFTGEISCSMLKNLGCKYVILGHSERRQYLRETDEMVNKKIKAALNAGLTPITCIGETMEQKTEETLEQQLTITLKSIEFEGLSPVVIVYEPVWAISTENGQVANPEDMKRARIFIKGLLTKRCGPKRAEKIQILYGGSVDSSNAKDYIIKAGFDGLLVGAASLNAEEFIKIIKILDKISREKKI